MKNLLVTTWYKFFKDTPDTYFGRLLIIFVPAVFLKKIEENYFNFDFRNGKLITIIRKGIAKKYYEQSDTDQLRINREKLWGGNAGKEWHEMRWKLFQDPKAYTTEFLEPRMGLVAMLQKFLRNNRSYHTICEIGAGNGLFIDLLSKRLNKTSINRFIGLEINLGQIKNNQKRFKDKKRIQFLFSGAENWIRKNLKPGAIIIASGTFQCFTQAELETLFRKIAEKKFTTIIGLSETVNFDLESEIDSTPRGNTWFNHNYPYLIEKAGYKIIYKAITRPLNKGVVLVSLIAQSGKHNESKKQFKSF